MKFINSKIFSPLIAVALTACGPGGGSSSSDISPSAGGIQEITISSLTSQEVFEGETVTLSLGARGTNAQNLSFDWDLSYAGGEIDFSGQGTDTIRFTAPEVTGRASISVSVDIDLEGGTLLGNNREFGSVYVIDTNPVEAVDAIASVMGDFKTTTLSTVESIDSSMIGQSEQTWRLSYFSIESTEILTGDPAEISQQNMQYAFFAEDGDSDQFRLCTARSSASLSALIDEQLPCKSSFAEKQYYQGLDAFRVEHSCDGQLIKAVEFSKVADEILATQGDFSLEHQSSEDLLDNAPNCVAITDRVMSISLEDDSGQEQVLELLSTNIEVVSELDGDSLSLVFSLGEIATFGFFNFDDPFSEIQTNFAFLDGDAFGELSRNSASEGTITLYTRNDGRVDARYDFELVNVESGETETLGGQFDLSF